jgi:6-phosphogluconolactonase (cycloisomerase 2 family)
MFIAVCSISSVAATSYVVVNNNNRNNNSVSAYKLNSANGTLTFYGKVGTTGKSLGGGIVAVGQAITSDAHCLFAIDTASNDIAAFASPSYKLVGKFSNSALNFSASNLGGGIAVSPNGKFVYGAYSGSGNIGAWRVNPNCSLTFIAAYVPSVGADFYAYLGVSPNGSLLVVSAEDFSAAESFKIGSNGSLTDLGFVSFAGLTSCGFEGCFPAALDFTKDSKVVVFGNSSDQPSVLTANIDTTGTLTNPQEWDLPNSQNLVFSNAVFLSAAAYAGSGFLFVGMVPGVVTANFTENPLSITTANSTTIPNYTGGIASDGSTLVLSEPPQDLGTFRINSDGSLTPLSTVTDTAGDPLWPTIYPNTR